METAQQACAVNAMDNVYRKAGIEMTDDNYGKCSVTNCDKCHCEECEFEHESELG